MNTYLFSSMFTTVPTSLLVSCYMTLHAASPLWRSTELHYRLFKKKNYTKINLGNPKLFYSPVCFGPVGSSSGETISISGNDWCIEELQPEVSRPVSKLTVKTQQHKTKMHNRTIFDLRRENFELYPVFIRLLILLIIQIKDTRYLRKILSLSNIKMPIIIVLLPIMQKPPLTLRPSFSGESGKSGFRCRTRYPSICILG